MADTPPPSQSQTQRQKINKVAVQGPLLPSAKRRAAAWDRFTTRTIRETLLANDYPVGPAPKNHLPSEKWIAESIDIDPKQIRILEAKIKQQNKLRAARLKAAHTLINAPDYPNNLVEAAAPAPIQQPAPVAEPSLDTLIASMTANKTTSKYAPAKSQPTAASQRSQRASQANKARKEVRFANWQRTHENDTEVFWDHANTAGPAEPARSAPNPTIVVTTTQVANPEQVEDVVDRLIHGAATPPRRYQHVPKRKYVPKGIRKAPTPVPTPSTASTAGSKRNKPNPSMDPEPLIDPATVLVPDTPSHEQAPARLKSPVQVSAGMVVDTPEGDIVRIDMIDGDEAARYPKQMHYNGEEIRILHGGTSVPYTLHSQQYWVATHVWLQFKSGSLAESEAVLLQTAPAFISCKQVAASTLDFQILHHKDGSWVARLAVRSPLFSHQEVRYHYWKSVRWEFNFRYMGLLGPDFNMCSHWPIPIKWYQS